MNACYKIALAIILLRFPRVLLLLLLFLLLLLMLMLMRVMMMMPVMVVVIIVAKQLAENIKRAGAGHGNSQQHGEGGEQEQLGGAHCRLQYTVST